LATPDEEAAIHLARPLNIHPNEQGQWNKAPKLNLNLDHNPERFGVGFEQASFPPPPGCTAENPPSVQPFFARGRNCVTDDD